MKMNLEKLTKLGILLLLLGGIVLISVQTQTADALIPDIVSVTSFDVGSVTWVSITVNHLPPPVIGPGHYVSNVQIEVNGTVQDLPQSPQSTETFTVQRSLGSSSNKYSVRARAFCNVHGYSAYSSPVTVPEFSLLAGAVFLILSTITLVIVKKALGLGRSTVDYTDGSPL